MKRRAGYVRGTWGLVGSAALTFSCLSGQTGSADCGYVPLSCQCETLAEKSLVKATVLDIDADGTVTLEIDQVLNPNAQLDESAAHRHISGTLHESVACNRNDGQPPQVGASVFAAFFSYESGDLSAPLSDLVLLPWSDDSVALGDGISLPLSEAIALTTPSTCEAQYPHGGQPCNDTPRCSINALPVPHTDASWWWLAPAFVGLAALGLRRRRHSASHE